MLRLDEQPYGSSLPRCALDQAIAFEGLDHLVDRGRGYLEVALEIRFRRRHAMDLRVLIYEGNAAPVEGAGGWEARVIPQA